MTARTTLSLTLVAALALAACSRNREEAATPSATPPVADTAPVAMPTPNTPVAAGTNPPVGGVAMLPSQTIVANAATAPNLKTLVAAVQAAGLSATLASPGPFTVFAPTDTAFARLAPGTVDSLLKPANKPSLVKLLTYHVVPGALSSSDLAQRVVAGGGTATLTTVEGEPLTVTMQGNVITLTDVNGNKSYVETADVRQSNGMVHVVNGVLVPKLG
jgi:uncharacterized surface protein with fasciclin (FAS1) repeats